MTRQLPRSVALGLLAALAAGVCPGQVPDTTIRDYKMSEAVNLVRQGQGSVLVFHLYASWCPPCQKEFPDLVRLCERYKGHPFQMLAFSLDKQPADLQVFLKAHKAPFEYRRLLLTSVEESKRGFQSLGMQYDLKAIPYTAVLDPSGKVVSEWTSYKTYRSYVTLLDGVYLGARPVPAKDPPPAGIAGATGAAGDRGQR